MTDNAKRDENRIATLLAVANDGSLTPVDVYVDAVTHRLLVNATVTGNIQVAGLVSESYDAVKLSQTGTEDIYKFYSGGISGTLIATVTITYTDSSKETIDNVVRT
jgi:hypothetical protein